MKTFIKSVLLWSAAMCLIPLAAHIGKESGEEAATAFASSSGTVLPTDKLKIYTSKGDIRTVTVEEYTVYAVLAEIPEILEPEAMKAQACAARTYAVRRILSGENSETGTHISDDSEKHQICLTDSQARTIYGESYSEALAAAKSAAEATCGEIIVFEGSPIYAPFHRSSGEYTLSALSAWGKDFPYLVAVKNPEDSVQISEKTFTEQELYARVSADFPVTEKLDEIALSYVPDTPIVSEARLCGIALGGDDLMRILSLESRNFSVKREGKNCIFTVTGSGHLVGMSISGANAMAKSGCGYREILSHYYTGTEVERVSYQ